MENQPGLASPRFSTDHFESVLPPEALEELRRRKPRTRQQRTKAKWSCPPWLRSALLSGALAASPLFVLAVIAAITWATGASLIKKPSVLVSTPSPYATASPAPLVPAPTPPPPVVEVRRAEPVVPAAPRATLVRLPVPRDDVFAISPEHLDESHDIMMPYGMVVRATLRGFLEQENQLPRVGHIGDMYVVGSVPWIFIQVPGTTALTWVDP
jgi:hypothetical protein